MSKDLAQVLADNIDVVVEPVRVVMSDAEVEAAKERILAVAASGGWMQTFHGKKIYLDVDKFNVDDVLIADIVHHLPGVNRYCNATLYPVSVAQHSVALARSFRRRWQELQRQWKDAQMPYDVINQIAYLQRCEKQALLHDITESYTNDLLAPFKQMMPQIKILDGVMVDAVVTRYGVGPTLELEVVEMDRRMCRNEMDIFGSPHVHRWWDALEPVPGVDPHDLRKMDIDSVRKSFQRYLSELGIY